MTTFWNLGFGAAAVSLLVSPVLGEVVKVVPGDLLLGFYEVSEDGAGVGSNTYVLNLGAGAFWRENTAATVSVGNILADLDDAFGAGWQENGRLRAGVVGVVGPTDPLTAGDPARTLYYSQAAASFVAGATNPLVLSSSQMGSASTQLKTFAVETNGKASGVNGAGAKLATSANNNYASFQPPLTTTSFGISASPNGSFGAGVVGSSGGHGVELALDVYRLLFSTVGADLTAGLASGNAVAKQGQYVGTFTIDAGGEVRMERPTPPAVSGYAEWALGMGLTGSAGLPQADPDRDGMANSLEFVMGSHPGVAGDASLLPVAVRREGVLEFSYRRSDAAAYVAPSVEIAAQLEGPWVAAPAGAVEDDFYGAKVDRVTVRIPASGDRLFARLRVTVP